MPTDGDDLDRLDADTRALVLAKAASALAEPARLRILELLDTRGELTVAAITRALPVSQPRVSVHLRCLTECGLTAVRRDGRRAYYRVAGDHARGLLAAVRHHAAGSLDGILSCLHCPPSDSAAGDAEDPATRDDSTGSCC